MKESLLAYFEGERNGGLVLASVGVCGVVFAGVLSMERWNLRTFAIALAVIALLELGLGVGLYVKTGPQLAGLVDKLASEPASFYASEAARMAKVQRNFVWLEVLWVLLALGAGLLAVFKKTHPTPLGIGMALAMHATVFLAFDLVAERRGALYYAALQEPGKPAKVIKRNPYDD